MDCSPPGSFAHGDSSGKSTGVGCHALLWGSSRPIYPALKADSLPFERLEFPRETGLILRCAGKAGNPFQTTQGNRHSCRDQEARRADGFLCGQACPSSPGLPFVACPVPNREI